MKKTIRIQFITFLILTSSGLFAQSGYKINFKIKGLKDTTAYLGYYFWEQARIKDTARVNSQGVCTFEGRDKLPQGVYLFVLNNTSVFQLVVGDQQQFTLETATEDYIKNMVVKGDNDNRLYFENLVFEREQHKIAE